MFYNLTQGASVFMLHKTNKPYVEVGTVDATSSVHMPYYPNMPMMPVDLTIKVGDKTVTYQRLPCNAEVADAKDITGETVSVACTREALSREIASMRQKALDVINSVDMYRQQIGTLDGLMQELNPELAEKAAQQAEINLMKSQMADMSSNITKLMTENRELLDKILSMRGGEGTSSED